MKKLIVMILIICIVLLSGCGNKKIFDTQWTFTRAIIDFGGEIIEVDVRNWTDYEGDCVQVISTDGVVYLTSYKNLMLISD